MDDKLIKTIYQLAWGVVKRIGFKCHSFDKEDLVQVAVMKGVSLVPKYKPDSSAKLSTFLTKYMRHAVIDYISLYCKERNLHPGYRDISTRRFSDMDNEAAGTEDQHEWDIRARSSYIENEKAENPTTKIEVCDELEKIRRDHLLDERTWQILLLRFGNGLTWKQVGKAVGVSAYRIYEIEKEACGMLQIARPGQNRSPRKGCRRNLTEPQHARRREIARMGGLAHARKMKEIWARRAAAGIV